MKRKDKNGQLSFNFEQPSSDKVKQEEKAKRLSLEYFNEIRRNYVIREILNNTKSF